MIEGEGEHRDGLRQARDGDGADRNAARRGRHGRSGRAVADVVYEGGGVVSLEHGERARLNVGALVLVRREVYRGVELREVGHGQPVAQSTVEEQVGEMQL